MRVSTDKAGVIHARLNAMQLHTIRCAVAIAVDQYWSDAAASETAKNERLKDQFTRQARDAQAILDNLSMDRIAVERAA